jgi:hypothetical protein
MNWQGVGLLISHRGQGRVRTGPICVLGTNSRNLFLGRGCVLSKPLTLTYMESGIQSKGVRDVQQVPGNSLDELLS